MNPFKHLPRILAAAAFAASASTAIVLADASHAGDAPGGLIATAPQAADAAVVVGIGIRVGGPYRYGRYSYVGGAWTRVGFAYGSAPGYFGGYYLGYGPPARGYVPPGYHGHPYYGHPYWGHLGWDHEHFHIHHWVNAR